jgi:hypothetical protein
MTATEILQVAQAAVTAALGEPASGVAAPAEIVATPAVTLTPADPHITVNRKIGACPEVTWRVGIAGRRWDLATSLEELGAAYVAAARALARAGANQIGPFGSIGPIEIAGVPVIAGSFPLTTGGPPHG